MRLAIVGTSNLLLLLRILVRTTVNYWIIYITNDPQTQWLTTVKVCSYNFTGQLWFGEFLLGPSWVALVLNEDSVDPGLWLGILFISVPCSVGSQNPRPTGSGTYICLGESLKCKSHVKYILCSCYFCQHAIGYHQSQGQWYITRERK